MNGGHCLPGFCIYTWILNRSGSACCYVINRFREYLFQKRSSDSNTTCGHLFVRHWFVGKSIAHSIRRRRNYFFSKSILKHWFKWIKLFDMNKINYKSKSQKSGDQRLVEAFSSCSSDVIIKYRQVYSSVIICLTHVDSHSIVGILWPQCSSTVDRSRTKPKLHIWRILVDVIGDCIDKILSCYVVINGKNAVFPVELFGILVSKIHSNYSHDFLLA